MLPILHDVMRREDIRIRNNLLRNKRKHLRSQFDLDILSEERFIELFRVNKTIFQYLCEQLAPHLTEPRYRSGVTVEQKLLSALRFYACGCYQRSVGEDFNLGLSQTSIHRYIHEVTNAVNTHLTRDHIKFPTTRREVNEVKEDFMNKFNFPGVLGAIDGTHVAILKPSAEEHNFINRKGYHSLNVQVICDSNLKLLSVYANSPGSNHDAFIWRNSAIKNFMMNQYNMGRRRTWLLGDSGYPLQPILMTPFLNPENDSPEFRYNYSHIRTRNCIERCIGVLKNRFRCLLRERVARYSPEFVGKLVNTCAVLHNLCIDFNVDIQNLDDYNMLDEEIHDIDFGNMANLGHQEGDIVRRNIVNTYFA